jgi:hypothetical protein
VAVAVYALRVELTETLAASITEADIIDYYQDGFRSHLLNAQTSPV